MLLSGVLSAAESIVVQVPSSIRLQISNEVGAELKLEVRQAPLAQVLKEIADKIGARIHYSVLPEAPITATCVGSEVRQLMDCLLAKQVGLVANSPQQGNPAEFWLLGSSVGSCQAVTVNASPQPLAETDQEAEPTPEEQAQIEQAMQAQSDRFLEQAKAKDSKQRAEAISNLISGGVKNDPNVRKALEEALTDKDANVRAQAVTALAKREGESAAETLRQALKDNDVNVRLMAVENAGKDAVLLQQALNDKNPTIRNYAASKLEALNKTQ